MFILETLSLVLTSETAKSVARFLYEKVGEYVSDRFGDNPSEEVERLEKEIEDLKNKLESKDSNQVTQNELDELKEKVTRIEQKDSPLPPEIVSGEVFQKWTEKGNLDFEDQASIVMRQIKVLMDKAGELGVNEQKRFEIQQVFSSLGVNLKNLKEAKWTARLSGLRSDKEDGTRMEMLLVRNIHQARDLLKGY